MNGSGLLLSEIGLLEHKHSDTAVVADRHDCLAPTDCRGEHVPCGRLTQRADSRPGRDGAGRHEISSLCKTGCNSECVNCLFLEFFI